MVIARSHSDRAPQLLADVVSPLLHPFGAPLPPLVCERGLIWLTSLPAGFRLGRVHGTRLFHGDTDDACCRAARSMEKELLTHAYLVKATDDSWYLLDSRPSQGGLRCGPQKINDLINTAVARLPPSTETDTRGLTTLLRDVDPAPAETPREELGPFEATASCAQNEGALDCSDQASTRLPLTPHAQWLTSNPALVCGHSRARLSLSLRLAVSASAHRVG